ACLLARSGELEGALEYHKRVPELAAHTLISNQIAYLVHARFDIAQAGGDCDRILGWSKSGRFAPLLSQSDILTIMDIIWTDRWVILTVSGVSGLLFLFSRYVFHERFSRRSPEAETLKNRLHELALRSILVADRIQRTAMLHVIDANPCYIEWNDSPKHVNVVDSRLIMSAFSRRLSDDHEADLLVAPEAVLMLRLVALSTDVDTQDLLPGVIQCAIKLGWAVLLSPDFDNDIGTFVQVLFQALRMLISPTHTRPYRLLPHIRTQIVEVIHESDALDLTAHALIHVNPSSSP
ncbi:unnamed protein product, partial [Rhizoctonia solani]